MFFSFLILPFSFKLLVLEAMVTQWIVCSYLKPHYCMFWKPPPKSKVRTFGAFSLCETSWIWMDLMRWGLCKRNWSYGENPAMNSWIWLVLVCRGLSERRWWYGESILPQVIQNMKLIFTMPNTTSYEPIYDLYMFLQSHYIQVLNLWPWDQIC